MFVVVEGELEATHQGQLIERLGPGGVFGEIAVLLAVPRLATVRATEDCLLIEVPRLVFERLGDKYPPLRSLLQNVFKERILMAKLQTNPVFAAFGPEQLKRVA